MPDTVIVSPTAPSVATPKKVAAKKRGTAKKPTIKANHPPTLDIVTTVIAALKEKKGSSLQAIKKYIAATYKISVEKQSTFIKKYLKLAVTKKIIVQTKGSGASGRFKLASKGESEKKVTKKPAVKKLTDRNITAAKKPVQKVVARKQTAKKAVSVKPEPSKAKSPSKAKKSGKAPVTKPKAPKPKKVTTSKAKAVKK